LGGRLPLRSQTSPPGSSPRARNTTCILKTIIVFSPLWNMAVEVQGSAVQQPARPTLRTRYSTDLETIRGRFRFTGALLIMAGALYLATIVIDSLSGQAGRVMLATIAAAALLIGGTKLLVQRYSAGLDTIRRSAGIVGLALGTVGIGFGLWGVGLWGGGRVASWTDLLTLLGLLNLVLGFGGILIGALSHWSLRYAAWYQRRWEKSQRRRSERLGRRR